VVSTQSTTRYPLEIFFFFFFFDQQNKNKNPNHHTFASGKTIFTECTDMRRESQQKLGSTVIATIGVSS
jgi:hypothetical protein